MSIIHLYLYGQFRKHNNYNNVIHAIKLKAVLKWYVRVPKEFHNRILEEMIAEKLLNRVNRDTYTLLPVDCKCVHDSKGNPLW